MEYDHYIGLDLAQQNMALAHMTRHSNEVDTIDVRSDISDLKDYLGRLRGTKILTFEETNPAQWLFTELSRVLKIPIFEQISGVSFFSKLNFLKFFDFPRPNLICSQCDLTSTVLPRETFFGFFSPKPPIDS